MTSRLRSNDGASTVIVAIALLLLLGAGAIAIDLGSMWETKREIIVDSDAAALAAARVAAVEGCGTTGNAEAAADEFLAANNDNGVTASIDCHWETNAITPNTVEVSFTDQAQETLSPVVGANQLDVFTSSTAEFNGFAVGKLRPLVVCVDAIDASASPGRYIVPMEKTWQSDGCGGTAGQWGFLCFDVSIGCDNGDFEYFLAEGFPRDGDPPLDLGSLALTGGPHAYNDPLSDETCGALPGTPAWCLGSTGANLTGGPTGSQSTLDRLVAAREVFSVVITDCIGELAIDGSCDPMTGSKGTVHQHAVAHVIIDGWCKRGNRVSNSDWTQYPGAGLTNDQCFNATGVDGTPASVNELVLAFDLLGVDLSGTPDEWTNPDAPVVQLCGADSDPDVVAGTIDNRCDRTF